MLGKPPFYHQTIRNCIIGFGKMFSDVEFERFDNSGTAQQKILVPIAYGPKEKWVQRLEQDPTLEDQTYTTLPRMSFEMAAISYDPLRKTNRMGTLKINRTSAAGGSGKRDKLFAPVPFNLDMQLNCLTKTTEDGLQMVEQILPFFTPEFTMKIKNTDPTLETETDVPIILNSSSFVDDYDGTFEIRRFVTWTFNFTLKIMLFGGVDQTGSVITSTFVDLGNPDEQHRSTGDLNNLQVTDLGWNITQKTDL